MNSARPTSPPGSAVTTGSNPATAHDAVVVPNSASGGNFFSLLWRHKIALVIGILLGAVLGAALALLQPASYAAESRIFFSTQNAFDPLAGDMGNTDPSRYLEQQAALLTSEPVLAAAVESDPAIGDTERVHDSLTVTASREADIVTVRATADSGTVAVARINAVVAAYRAYQQAAVDEQTKQLRELSSADERRRIQQRAALYGDGVRLVEPPAPKEVSILARNTTVGALVGLLLGLAWSAQADVRRRQRSAASGPGNGDTAAGSSGPAGGSAQENGHGDGAAVAPTDTWHWELTPRT